MAVRSLPVIAAAVALSGCAIRQHVKPVEAFDGKEVCIITNGSVRTGFIESYKRALTTKGYLVRQLPATASLNECPVVSTYTANWRWDLATYMAFAEITVYRDAKPIGAAKYDAMHGGGNLGKFIDADKKIGELVHQLFPGGAGTL